MLLLSALIAQPIAAGHGIVMGENCGRMPIGLGLGRKTG